MTRNDLYAAIERCIGSAYDLGHAHGFNVYLYSQKMEPKRTEEGWWKFYEEVLEAVDAFLMDLHVIDKIQIIRQNEILETKKEHACERNPGCDSNDV